MTMGEKEGLSENYIAIRPPKREAKNSIPSLTWENTNRKSGLEYNIQQTNNENIIMIL